MTIGDMTIFADGNVLYDHELNDNFKNIMAARIIPTSPAISFTVYGVVAFSATTFSIGTSEPNIYHTTDSGATWTAKLNKYATQLKKCDADSTKAFSIYDTALGVTAYTSDSGTTWTQKATFAYGTGLYDFCFPVSGLIVVGGDDAAGINHIVFSTDQGTTWTDATTQPDTKIYAVDMFDGTTGYAIDSDKKIWKTTNAAVDWTDTGHVTSATYSVTDGYTFIRCISATLCVIGSTSAVQMYNNSTGAIVIYSAPGQCKGLVKNTNGYLYAYYGTTGASNQGWLLMSDDSGSSWGTRPMLGGTNGTSKQWIHEVGATNYLATIYNPTNHITTFYQR